MKQPGDVPLFRGDLSPDDTDGWLQTLVAATGHFTDAGIFRLLCTKFVKGSPAREWFDGLDGEAKTSWTVFEQEFYARWITTPQVTAKEDAKWDEFCNHKLTYEKVFAQDIPDLTLIPSIVIYWARHHFHLGQSSNRDEQELIEATMPLLPAFIQAYLQVYSASATASFNAYCLAVEDIPVETYQFEWLRQQKSSKDLHSLEMRIKEVSQKVDRILVAHGELGTSTDAASQSQAHVESTDERSGGSVAWEPCSPLTSVMSTDGHSEVATPTAEQRPLPEVAEAPLSDLVPASGLESQDDASLPIPQGWRKPVTTLSRADRIAIADQCLDFALNFESVITHNQASSLNASIAVYDKLINRQSRNRDSRSLLPISQHPEKLWYLLELVHRYRAGGQPLSLYLCQEEWRMFIVTEGVVKDQHLGFICPRQHDFGASWSSEKTWFNQQSSGVTTFFGAFFKINRWPWENEISSANTVLFMTLSSYLVECTSDPGILGWAIQSAICIKTHMLDSETNLIKDFRFMGSELPGSTISCHLTGIAIEGFSVLATVSGDDTWRALALDLAEAAMRSKEWHGSDGILTVNSDSTPYVNTDAKAFKGSLNRGLMVAYQRNPDDKPIRNLIRSYVNVQFNALLDLSSRRNSYGVDWRGPYVGPFPHAQLAALDTLIAAIGVNDS